MSLDKILRSALYNLADHAADVVEKLVEDFSPTPTGREVCPTCGQNIIEAE